MVAGLVVLLAACGDDGGSVSAGTAAPSSTDPAPTTPAPSTSVQRPALYEGTGTVLEAPEHGPQLCLGGVDDSYPPQCEGTELVGWDWAGVDDEESSGGTTWGDYHVVGAWDGERFTVTEPPGPPQYVDSPDPGFVQACDDPTGDPDVPETEELALQDSSDVVRRYVSYDPFVVNVLVRPGAADEITAAVRDQWDGLLCVVERDEPTEDELRAVQDELEAAIDEDTPLGYILGIGVYALQPYVGVEVVILTPEGEAYAQERWGDLVRVTGSLQPVE
jgi:hypothetical protein